MSWRPRPILLLHGADNLTRGYLDELLIQEGYLAFESIDQEALEVDGDLLDGRALVIADARELNTRTRAELARFIHQGGAAILIKPSAEVIGALNLPIAERPARFYAQAPPGYLRFSDHPWVGQHAGALVQCHDNTNLWRIDGGRPLAVYALHKIQPSQYAAITEHDCGGGRVAIFWFDPARSIILTRQGAPEYASTGLFPDSDADGMFKASDLNHGLLDFELRGVPQADLLADVLVGVIRGLTDPILPMPRVWHMPADAPAMTLLDGDSDLVSWELYAELTGRANAHGIPYTLNLFVDDFEKITRSAADEIFAAGNDVELHYWLGDQRATIADALRVVPEQHRRFSEIIGRRCVGSRGHSVIWPGYMEMAELLADEGWRLDTNFIPLRGCQHGYVNGSGRAARFITADGALLPISQQGCQLMDDAMFGSKSLIPSLTPEEGYEVTMRHYQAATEQFHGVVNVCLHASSYSPRAYGEGQAAMLQALIDAGQRYSLAALSVREWVAFQEARRKLSLTYQGGSWRLGAPEALRDVTVHMPAQTGTLRQSLCWATRTLSLEAEEDFLFDREGEAVTR